MSTKNFVSYGDAETLFTGVGNKISGKQAKPTTISYADWLLLTPQQQETGNWLVTGVPGADLSLRVLALETNKQDKTDNNLQTESKETTGAINELKSGLTNLDGKFATVALTLADTVDGTVAVSMPAGWTAENAMILAFNAYYVPSTTWFTNNNGVEVDANSSSVWATVKNAGFASQTCNVLLFKFA